MEDDRDTIRRLRVENAAFKSALESNAKILKAQVEDSQENEKRLRAELEHKTREANVLRDTLRDATAQLEQSQAELAHSSAELEAARKYRVQAEADLAQVRREREEAKDLFLKSAERYNRLLDSLSHEEALRMDAEREMDKAREAVWKGESAEAAWETEKKMRLRAEQAERNCNGCLDRAENGRLKKVYEAASHVSKSSQFNDVPAHRKMLREAVAEYESRA